jgi:hypothetical protein
MKRIAWVLLIGLWCGSLAMAQIGSFTQRGKATQELKTDGISIAHPSLPLNSKATITNTKTGRSVEATVTARVPASASRIADLSSGAWNELGLDADSEITISTSPPPRPRVAAPAQPPDDTAVAAAPPVNTPVETPPPAARDGSFDNQNPIHITLHNYITLPEDKGILPLSTSQYTVTQPVARPVAASAPPQQAEQRYVPDPDLQRRLTATAAYARSQPLYASPPIAPPPAAVPVQAVQPQEPKPQEAKPPVIVVPSYNVTVVPVYQTQQMTTIQPPAPVQRAPVQAPPAYQPQVAPVCDPIPAPVYQPAPPPGSTTVRVIPGYPDPNCGKLYTLQVGAYSTANAASKAESLMKNNGFNVSQELSKPYYRIIISGVQASTVYALVQRLGTIGVEEVIIR